MANTPVMQELEDYINEHIDEIFPEEIRPMTFMKTKDVTGKENGWMIEVYKEPGTDRTIAYQTLAYGTPDPLTPVVKGYHCYRKQTNNLTCVSGKVTIRVLWDKIRKVDYKLAEHTPICLTIPPENPFAIINEDQEFARVINHPEPYWEAENFKTDQYIFEPTRELLDQNGEVFDYQEFKND